MIVFCLPRPSVWAAPECRAPAASPAPAVLYTLLDGAKANRALRGKVVLVNFWATSCASCVAEMPQIAGTFDQFKGRGFETLAVAMSYDAPALVARFTESRRLPFGRRDRQHR